MDGATRIWLDDPNPIFRMGLAASLRDPRFVVVGESSGFVPAPALENVDVLVFDLGAQENVGLDLTARTPVLRRRHRRSTRLVGLVPGGDVEAAERSQCTILVRSELTPEGFRNCLASVAAQAPPPAPPPAGRPLDRLRRLLKRRVLLLGVVAALAASAVGPTGRAEGLSASAVSVPASVETTPVESFGDAADDVAVWVNPVDAAASLVIGTDKRGGLESYDLKGRRVQRIQRRAGFVNNVDIRTGFTLGGHTVALVGTGGRLMSFFRIDPATRQLSEVGAGEIRSQWSEVGFCLYRSSVTDRLYAFVTEPDGEIRQYEVFDRGGLVDARPVRNWRRGGPVEGCVADDETGWLFVSEERVGIWRYEAEPEAETTDPVLVDNVDDGHVARDVEGLAIVVQPGGQGFLLASSQGDSTFAVYRRRPDHAWLGQRQVSDGSRADGCSSTDGIEAVAADLGPDFPSGIFVCHDGRNTAPGSTGRQNFKYVRLERLLEAAGPPS